MGYFLMQSLVFLKAQTMKGENRRMQLDWKPCRVIHCYKIEEGIAYIVGFDGIIKLNKSASVVWRLADGKHTIRDIVDELKKLYQGADSEVLLQDVETVLDRLAEKGSVIRDWDPLLKDQVSEKEKYL